MHGSPKPLFRRATDVTASSIRALHLSPLKGRLRPCLWRKAAAPWSLRRAGSEPRLKLWDMDSGCDTMLHYNLPRAAAPLSASGGLAESAIAMSTDSSLLFVPWGLTLRVYDTFSASCVGVLKGHFDRILSCAARRDIPQVFTGGADGQIVCWDDHILMGSRGKGVTMMPQRTIRRRIAFAGGIGNVIEPLPDEDFWSD